MNADLIKRNVSTFEKQQAGQNNAEVKQENKSGALKHENTIIWHFMVLRSDLYSYTLVYYKFKLHLEWDNKLFFSNWQSHPI